MIYSKDKKEINIDKVLNELDKFTIDFIKNLERNIEYVLVSGYVSILLGRSRSSEDIDLLVPKMNFNEFKKIFNDLILDDYECANTMNIDEAYTMLSYHAIRFFKKGKPLPNMEFKMISLDIQEYALKNRIRVVIDKNILYISPLELQITYKLSLMSGAKIDEVSSNKDFEDAKHIYELFKEELDSERLNYFIDYFKVSKQFEFMQNE